MTTVRRGSLPTDNFTIISNGWVRDTSLSWAARGLLTWLASHADGYSISEDKIINSAPEGRGSGRDAVRGLIRELEQGGYLTRRKVPILTGGSTVDYELDDPRPTAQPTDGQGVGRAEQGELFPAKNETAGQATDGPTDGQGVGRSSSREDQKKNKTPSGSRGARLATRVPDDFYPDDKMTAWFVSEQFGRVINGKAEHEKFMDHFRAAPGEKGRKMDWPATWRNWMRRAAEDAARYDRRPGNSLVPTSGAPYRPSTTDQKVAQTLELGRRLQAMEDAQ